MLGVAPPKKFLPNELRTSGPSYPSCPPVTGAPPAGHQCPPLASATEKFEPPECPGLGNPGGGFTNSQPLTARTFVGQRRQWAVTAQVNAPSCHPPPFRAPAGAKPCCRRWLLSFPFCYSP